MENLMDRVTAELERLVDRQRIEIDGNVARGASGRQLLVRMLSLRWALADATRRRYAALATQFDLRGNGALHDLVDGWATDGERTERMAEAGLWELAADAVAVPLDAKLWNAYFGAIVVDQPWSTLGAMVAWEELSSAAIDVARRWGSTRRIMPDDGGGDRGSELAVALERETLEREELTELLDGISVASVMGLRLTRWAAGHEETGRGRVWPTSRWAAGQF